MKLRHQNLQKYFRPLPAGLAPPHLPSALPGPLIPHPPPELGPLPLRHLPVPEVSQPPQAGAQAHQELGGGSRQVGLGAHHQELLLWVKKTWFLGKTVTIKVVLFDLFCALNGNFHQLSLRANFVAFLVSILDYFTIAISSENCFQMLDSTFIQWSIFLN